MANVNEKLFEQPDPKNPDYSMTEYDLYAKLGLSIRKNIKLGRYEIFKLKSKDVVFSGTLQDVVTEANRLEGSENTIIRGNF